MRHSVRAEELLETAQMRPIDTPDGYSFTSEAATAIARRILRGDFLPGFQTPAKVYGADFVLGFKGTRRVGPERVHFQMQAGHIP